MKTVYITEPDVINVATVKSLLPEEYEIVVGDMSFSGVVPKDCTILIIRSATTITPSIKEVFPNLAHVIRIGTGVDTIDMDFCHKEGIAVYNAPGANADAVSDYVIGMMLVALRKIYLLTKQDIVSWNRFKYTGHSMSSRSIGIIGFGNIGRQLFIKLKGFGCKDFFVYDPLIKKEDVPEGVTYETSVEAVLEKSNIVTLHVPLIPSTQYLISRRNLGLLANNSILLNASRGGIVNEADIIEFIQSHHLVYIADTVEGEPNVASSLVEESNIIITPHIASLTEESEDTMLRFAIENFLHNIPMNTIIKS